MSDNEDITKELQITETCEEDELEMGTVEIDEIYSYFDYTSKITYDHLKVPWKKLKKRMKLNRLYQYTIDNYPISKVTSNVQKQIFQLLINNIDKLNVDYDKKIYKITKIKSHTITIDINQQVTLNENKATEVIRKKVKIDFY